MRKLVASIVIAAGAAGCSGGGGGDKADRDVIVGIVSGPITESGDQASFTVVLRGQPSADVVIPVTSTDLAEGTVSPASLTFTRVNWDAPQTVLVTGVDDPEKDGNTAFTIALGPAESTDKVYGGFDPGDVLVTNLDDETAAVRISSISGQTTELGTAATFDVVLQSRPTSDVLLIFGTSDLSEGTTGGLTSMTFTTTNWDSPQIVTVTGVDDPNADGAQNYAILFQAAFSEDPEYAFLPVDAVPVTNLDDDSAGILVSKLTGITSELLHEETYSVRLLSRPTATVSLTWTLSDTSEGSFTSTGSSTLNQQFTINNWDTVQTFTMRGDNDTLADGDQPYTITNSAITSQDTAYAGLTRPVINLVNVDDDIAGFIVGAPTGPTSETGNSATFTVSLRAAATSSVVVNLSSTLPGEGTVTPASLTLTTTPQTVTVAGKLDFKRDGHKPFAVAFTPAVSTDPAYSGRQIANVGLTNIDNGPVRRALIFDDAYGTHADEAADVAGYEVTTTTDHAAFDTAFDTSEIHFIIFESTTAMLPAATESRLVSWVSSGGLLILSHWDLASSASLQSALEITATQVPAGTLLAFPATGHTPDVFGGSNPFPNPLVGDAVAGNFANELMVTTTNGKIASRFTDPTTGAGAITRTLDGAAVVNGLSPDDLRDVDAEPGAQPGDGIPDVRELYLNEIASLSSAGGGLPSPQRFDNNTPLAVPDGVVGDYVFSDIVVSGIPANATKVIVSFHITTTYDGDVDAWLVGPDGSTTVELTSDNGNGMVNFGSSCSPDSNRTTFDDAAATAITAGTAPYLGSYRPEQPLSAFAGQPANGTWRLRLDDDAGGDITTLQCWSLIVEF